MLVVSATVVAGGWRHPAFFEPTVPTSLIAAQSDAQEEIFNLTACRLRLSSASSRRSPLPTSGRIGCWPPSLHAIQSA
jgi:hypothetical protein